VIAHYKNAQRATLSVSLQRVVDFYEMAAVFVTISMLERHSIDYVLLNQLKETVSCVCF